MNIYPNKLASSILSLIN